MIPVWRNKDAQAVDLICITKYRYNIEDKKKYFHRVFTSKVYYINHTAVRYFCYTPCLELQAPRLPDSESKNQNLTSSLLTLLHAIKEIRESSRLTETSKIVESNLWPNTECFKATASYFLCFLEGMRLWIKASILEFLTKICWFAMGSL